MVCKHSGNNKVFIVTFPLQTELWQEHILNKRFEICRQIYNAILGIAIKRIKEMRRTKRYRELIASLSNDKENNKVIWKEIEALRQSFGLTKYGLSNLATPMKQHFKGQVDIHTVQKITVSVWKAIESIFFRSGKKVHFKKYGELNSVENKTNTSGIRFKNDCIEWFGLKIPVKINSDNPYEAEALTHKVKYNRIVRKYVGHKIRYYVQIVFEGIPPRKRNKSDGRFAHQLGSGDVGLDIGTSTIAVSSQNEVRIIELADQAKLPEKEILRIQRKIDRSRRTTNPRNFNSDGTIKKGAKHWIYSKHYKYLIERYKEICRKLAAIRKYQHECLANWIISLGDTIYVENMNFQGLAKKAVFSDNEKINSKGKYKRRKRFGKSVSNRAPAMLIEIINRKLNYFDKQIIKIDTRNARASQFSHFDQTYKKKKLSQRWNYFGEYKIQRDLYSAFLIMNVNPDLKTFNLDKCNERFERFYEMHNLEVNRLNRCKNLSSIGI